MKSRASLARAVVVELLESRQLLSAGASISGRVFSDNNANGLFDAGDTLLANRKIYLDVNKDGKFESGEPSVLSNANGVYSFTGLAQGVYSVRRADVPAGYFLTSPKSGAWDVELEGNVLNVSGLDFGAAPGSVVPSGASISGRVFNDANNDGLYEPGDTLLAGRKIYIDVNKDGKFESGEPSILSGANGVYTFNSLLPGTYVLGRADLPAGYTLTSPKSGEWAENLAVGQHLTGLDFGAVPQTVSTPQGSISGTVFNDANGNNTFDAGDVPVPNATVYIDANANGKLDSGEQSVTSNASGGYTFSNLPDGFYRIALAVPASVTTTPEIGFYLVGVVGGSKNPGNDLGFQFFGGARITGIVFSDANQNGVFDSGDTLLSSRAIYIDANNNGIQDSGEQTVHSSTTGVYSFPGLASGTYHIRRADLPMGYFQTVPASGVWTVSVIDGQTISAINFGAATGSNNTGVTGSISGTAFNDTNKDATFDAGDSALSARKVYIDANNNGKLDSGEMTATTNAGGVYTFSDLAAGTYIIRRADTPVGYVYTDPLGGFYSVALSAGQAVLGKDIGVVAK